LKYVTIPEDLNIKFFLILIMEKIILTLSITIVLIILSGCTSSESTFSVQTDIATQQQTYSGANTLQEVNIILKGIEYWGYIYPVEDFTVSEESDYFIVSRASQVFHLDKRTGILYCANLTTTEFEPCRIAFGTYVNDTLFIEPIGSPGRCVVKPSTTINDISDLDCSVSIREWYMAQKNDLISRLTK